jgi:HEAT repeat protein
MLRGLEEQLEYLSRLRDEPDSERVEGELRKALVSRRNVVVARAARVAGGLELVQLADALVEAFFRLLDKPAKSDKGCLAKTAISEALYRLEAGCEELFQRGITHVQREPVFGGQVDTAAALRGHCAMGLVSTGNPDVMVRLARLLADPEAEARLVAARAIGYSGRRDGVPLLIHKALIGDPDVDVIGECFASLLAIDAEVSLDLVAGFLKNADAEVVDAAALALGESRLIQVLPLLRSAWEGSISAETRKTLLVAMALLRRDEAVEHLLGLVAGEPERDAAAAITALAAFRHDDGLVEEIRLRVEQRGERLLAQAFADAFEV